MKNKLAFIHCNLLFVLIGFVLLASCESNNYTESPAAKTNNDTLVFETGTDKGTTGTDKETTGTDKETTGTDKEAAIPQGNEDKTELKRNVENESLQNEELQPFIDELADHRLMKFSRYNSGNNGDGMRSENYVDLCARGSYVYHSSSNISIGGNISQESKDESGTWRVYRTGENVMLRFKSENGLEKEWPVVLQDGKLFINGERFYHIAKGEEFGPQSCN